MNERKSIYLSLVRLSFRERRISRIFLRLCKGRHGDKVAQCFQIFIGKRKRRLYPELGNLARCICLSAVSENHLAILNNAVAGREDPSTRKTRQEKSPAGLILFVGFADIFIVHCQLSIIHFLPGGDMVDDAGEEAT